MNFVKVGQASRPGDTDPDETGRWLAALESVVRAAGEDRAEFLLSALDRRPKSSASERISLPTCLTAIRSRSNGNLLFRATSPWRSGSRPSSAGTRSPWSFARTRPTAISAAISRATPPLPRSSRSASITSFDAVSALTDGDLVSLPAAFGAGRLRARVPRRAIVEDQLKRYRQEVSGEGLSSYPHPWLMPDFWQTPTGSMGIGPITAIYQARFLRYLATSWPRRHRRRGTFGASSAMARWTSRNRLRGLSLAAREGLDNLTFVINCNLQRLDGPVRGNGQIIPELESLFRGAGWNVIKVLWGSEWDALFARDKKHALLRRFAVTVDGKYQTLGAKDGGYNLLHFFDEDPEVHDLVAHMSDGDIDGLKRGGHDLRKLFAAFELRASDQGQADRYSRQDQEGFRNGRRGRIPHDLASGQEARYRRADRFPRPFRPSAHRRADRRARILQAGRRQRRASLSSRAPRGSRRLSAGAPERRGRCDSASAQGLRGIRSSSRGQGDVHDHGRRPALQQSR